MRTTRLVAISGGIGSGKSIVSKILAAKGFAVYDCDSRARLLMDCSDEIRQNIGCRVSAEALNCDGTLNRAKLAEIVFSDSDKLAILNSIVHGAVRDDLRAWTDSLSDSIAFVETAILYQSQLDAVVDEVWEVIAPVDLRVERVVARNGISAREVMARIQSQIFEPQSRHPHEYEIINDGIEALLPQINQRLFHLL